jgi:hypothetical protein
MDELNVNAIQEEAKRKQEMASRRLKEMKIKLGKEKEKAIHEYNLASENVSKIEIDLSAAIAELEVIQREEERVHDEYRKAKSEFKEFSTSKQLKSAYKIAKKSHNDIKEILTVAQDKLKTFKERYQNARNDKKKARKFKNKFEEGGSGIEKDWRLRLSKYGLGMPNSPAEQLLHLLAKNKEDLEKRRHKQSLDQFASKSLLQCGDRNRNRVIKSSIDMLQPLRNYLIIRRKDYPDEDDMNNDDIAANHQKKKESVKIPPWLFQLLPGGGRIVTPRYRWNGTLFHNSVSNINRVGKQLIGEYDNIIEPIFGSKHKFMLSGLQKLINNAVDGGSSGIIAHGHRKSGKTYNLFHMGGDKYPIPPKERSCNNYGNHNQTSNIKPIIPKIGEARLCQIKEHDNDGLLPRCIDAIYDRNKGLDNIAPKSDYVYKDKDAPKIEPYAPQYFYFTEISGIVVYKDHIIDLMKYKIGKQTGVKVELRWNTHLKTNEAAPLSWTLCKTRHEARSVAHHILNMHKLWSKEIDQYNLQNNEENGDNTLGSLIITIRLVRPVDPHHPVIPDLMLSRRITFCELEGFDIGIGDVVKPNKENAEPSYNVKCIEEIILKIKIKMLDIGNSKNVIRFNKSNLSKILQSYIGGATDQPPLRSTQTIILSCVGLDEKYSTSSARSLLLSSKNPEQALNVLGYKQEKARNKSTDGGGGGGEKANQDLNKLKNNIDRKVYSSKKHKHHQNRNHQNIPWIQTGIRDRNVLNERLDKRRSKIVTEQFNRIQKRRAFVGGNRNSGNARNEIKKVAFKTNVPVIYKRDIPVLNEKRTERKNEERKKITLGENKLLLKQNKSATTGLYSLSSLKESPERLHTQNIYVPQRYKIVNSKTILFPNVVRNAEEEEMVVMMDKNLVQEEVNALKVKRTQLEQMKKREQNQICKNSLQQSEPELTEDTFQKMSNWHSNNCDYGRVGSVEYQKSLDLQDWLEDLIVKREENV